MVPHLPRHRPFPAVPSLLASRPCIGWRVEVGGGRPGIMFSAFVDGTWPAAERRGWWDGWQLLASAPVASKRLVYLWYHTAVRRKYVKVEDGKRQ